MHSSPSSATCSRSCRPSKISNRNPKLQASKARSTHSLVESRKRTRSTTSRTSPSARRRLRPPLGGTGLSTSQVSEGSNLYFTNARVASYINSSSTIPSAAGGSWGNVLAWNGSNWASLATSSLGLRRAESPQSGAASPERLPTRLTYRTHSTASSAARPSHCSPRTTTRYGTAKTFVSGAVCKTRARRLASAPPPATKL